MPSTRPSRRKRAGRRGHLLALRGQRQFGSGRGHGHSLRGGRLGRCRAASAQPRRSQVRAPCWPSPRRPAWQASPGWRPVPGGRTSPPRPATSCSAGRAATPGRTASTPGCTRRRWCCAAGRGGSCSCRQDLNMVSGGMVQQAARAAGFDEREVIVQATPHARGPDGVLELPVQGPRVRHAAGPAVRGARARPAPLHVHGPAADAGDPARGSRPRARRGGLGHHATLRVTRNRSIEAHLADHGVRRGFGEGRASEDPRGLFHPVDPSVNVLRVDQLPPPARAGRGLGGVRRPRDGQQGHVPLLQRRSLGGRPPRLRGGGAPQRARGAGQEVVQRLRERPGGRRVGRARPLGPGGRRVGRAAARPRRCSPPGGRPDAGLSRDDRARLALDARLLLRPADTPFGTLGRPRPCSGSRT